MAFLQWKSFSDGLHWSHQTIVDTPAFYQKNVHYDLNYHRRSPEVPRRSFLYSRPREAPVRIPLCPWSKHGQHPWSSYLLLSTDFPYDMLNVCMCV